MSLFANATAKSKAANVKEAFKNEEGAIDLASIMVGIIVIGLIGGVIAATVFSVIPWAQDNASKQQLDSVSAAQSAFIGLASDSTAIKFGTGTATAGVGLADPANKLFDATTAGVKIAVTGTGTGAHYIAADKSASGKIFYITDSKTQATEANGTAGRAAATLFTGTIIATTATTINGIVFPANQAWTGSTAF